MAKNGICDPSTRWKRNFIGCKLTNHPTNIMNGMNKIIGKEKTKKGQAPENNEW